jgi:hypothetical protein
MNSLQRDVSRYAYRQRRVADWQTCQKFNNSRCVLWFDLALYFCYSANKYYFRKQQLCIYINKYYK